MQAHQPRGDATMQEACVRQPTGASAASWAELKEAEEEVMATMTPHGDFTCPELSLHVEN
jgi:hypothetical protein